MAGVVLLKVPDTIRQMTDAIGQRYQLPTEEVIKAALAVASYELGAKNGQMERFFQMVSDQYRRDRDTSLILARG